MFSTIVVGNIVKKSAVRNVSVAGRPTKVINVQVAVRSGGTKTEYIKCVVWGNDAEAISQYGSVGRSVSFEGHAKACHWTNDKNETRSWLEVHGQYMEFLNYGRNGTGPDVAPLAEDVPDMPEEEEIPF